MVFTHQERLFLEQCARVPPQGSRAVTLPPVLGAQTVRMLLRCGRAVGRQTGGVSRVMSQPARLYRWHSFDTALRR